MSAAIASEDRYSLGIIDQLHKLSEVSVGGAQNGRGRNRDTDRARGLIGCIGRRDVTGKRDYRRTVFQESSENRSIEDRMRLFRVDNPRGIERCGGEELVRVEFFERGRVQDAGLDVARNGDNRSSLLARIHQSVEEMDYTGAGGSEHRH